MRDRDRQTERKRREKFNREGRMRAGRRQALEPNQVMVNGKNVSKNVSEICGMGLKAKIFNSFVR